MFDKYGAGYFLALLKQRLSELSVQENLVMANWSSKIYRQKLFAGSSGNILGFYRHKQRNFKLNFEREDHSKNC